MHTLDSCDNSARLLGNALERVLEILMAAIGRELARFIVVEVWAYWRKQRRERKYEADMAAFRADKDNLLPQVRNEAGSA